MARHGTIRFWRRTMQRIIWILLATIIIGGCDGTFRTRTFVSSVCGGEVTGFTATAILYADSKLVVIPISEIRPNTEWRFILEPRLLRSSKSTEDFKDKVVTITGKRAEDAWINSAGTGAGGAITGTFNSATDHMLRACVNIPVNTAEDTEYQYMVAVDDIGDLDPRAKVKR